MLDTNNAKPSAILSGTSYHSSKPLLLNDAPNMHAHLLGLFLKEPFNLKLLVTKQI